MHIHRTYMRKRHYLHPHVVRYIAPKPSAKIPPYLHIPPYDALNEPQRERLLGLPFKLDLDRYAMRKRSTLVCWRMDGETKDQSKHVSIQIVTSA